MSNVKIIYNKRINNNFKGTKVPRVQIVCYFLIVTVLIYNSFLVFQTSNSTEVQNLKKNIRQVSTQVLLLRQKHARLIARIKKNADRFSSKFVKHISSYNTLLAPGDDYERLRRSIHGNTKELWLYISAILNRINNGTTKPVRRTLKKKLLEEVTERKRWLLVQQEQLLASEGYSEWRRQEAKLVSTIVQRRLWFLQNPHNCRTAKKLVCSHNQGGFGCKNHHLMFCLMFAYATKRLLVLSEKDWTYNMDAKGWNSVFYPLSETCNTCFNDKMVKWNGPGSNEARVLFMSVLDLKKALKTKPLLLPYFIPKDLAKRISRFNSDPSAWWAGQMLLYLLKPREHIQVAISDAVGEMNLTQHIADRLPMVGIHVRWTDKNREAPLFPLAEYMRHVEEYYAQLELTQPVRERSVYIATDDERVFKQAASLYPSYKLYGSRSRARLAGTASSRYTQRALTDLLADLYLLTTCHYVVGTFTSNYGKMAYELMQTVEDATHRFHSIDDVYFMCSSTLEPHYRRAVMRSSKHPALQIGDIIKHYYFKPGSVGKNMRTNEHGPIPWYKTEELLSTYKAPHYERIPVYIDDADSKQTYDNLENYFSFSFDIPRKLVSNAP